MRRDRSEGLAALLDTSDLPTGRAGPYTFRRQLGPKPISNREPSLAHLAASNSADLGAVSHAMTHARSQPDHKPAKPAHPRQADVSKSQGMADGLAQPQQQQSFAGFAPSSSSNQQAGTSGAMHTGGFVSPFSQPSPSGLDPMDAFAHLPEGLRIHLQAPTADDMSRTNSMVYNQVPYAHPVMLQSIIQLGRLLDSLLSPTPAVPFLYCSSPIEASLRPASVCWTA